MTFILGFFAAIKAMFMYGLLGAGIGFIAWCIGRFLAGFAGLVLAAGLGAAIVIGASASSYFGASQDCASKIEISSLETEKRRLQQQIDAQSAANDAQDKIITEQQKRLNDNERVMDELDKAIAAHSGDDSCGLNADELHAIGKLR